MWHPICDEIKLYTKKETPKPQLTFQQQKKAYFKSINRQRTMLIYASIITIIIVVVFATVMHAIFKA